MPRAIIPYPRSATSKPTIIYGLCDPATGHLRYVGKTTVGLRQRLYEHIKLAKNKKSKATSHKSNWIKTIIASGMEPEIFEIEVVPPCADWAESECFWIANFKAMGCSLTNITTGGDGVSGWVPSEETRRKISEAQIGKIIPEETRSAISKGLMGRIFSAEHKKKIGEALSGFKHSDAVRKKMSEAKLNDPKLHERLRLLAKTRRARIITDELRFSYGSSMRGKTMPDESRALISAAKTEYWRKWREQRNELNAIAQPSLQF